MLASLKRLVRDSPLISKPRRSCAFCSAALGPKTFLVVSDEGGAICAGCVKTAAELVAVERQDQVEVWLKDFPPSTSYFLGGCI